MFSIGCLCLFWVYFCVSFIICGFDLLCSRCFVVYFSFVWWFRLVSVVVLILCYFSLTGFGCLTYFVVFLTECCFWRLLVYSLLFELRDWRFDIELLFDFLCVLFCIYCVVFGFDIDYSVVMFILLVWRYWWCGLILV